MAKIQLNGMKFYGFHGCFAEEQRIGTYFSVDCTLEVNVATAAQNDDLSKTVDYQKVYSLIATEFQKPVALLETIAWNIIYQIKQQFIQTETVTIKIQKLNPPLGGKMDSVSIELNSEEVLF
ncbi:MAG: dihydroneopterin aldolase [Bacteroidales bacterium]|jgi:dihydroneopterin aldolase|nr:dihydroneopterin aldolase [Bacteroidales bacterium]